MQVVQSNRPHRLSGRPRRLNGLGAPLIGASKDEAIAAWQKVDSQIANASAAGTLYPRAAVGTQFWSKYALLQDEFYARRTAVYGYSQGITDWDKYIKEARDYAQKFLTLETAVVDEARKTGEYKETPGYIPPNDRPDDKADNTLLYVGLGVAVLAAIFLSGYLNRPAVVGVR